MFGLESFDFILMLFSAGFRASGRGRLQGRLAPTLHTEKPSGRCLWMPAQLRAPAQPGTAHEQMQQGCKGSAPPEATWMETRNHVNQPSGSPFWWHTRRTPCLYFGSRAMSSFPNQNTENEAHPWNQTSCGPIRLSPACLHRSAMKQNLPF